MPICRALWRAGKVGDYVDPKVLEAASFGESDAIYGENVQAAVILRPGMEATEGELRDYCRTKLSAFEVPERRKHGSVDHEYRGFRQRL